MCDSDGSYEPISKARNIKTRKAHECGCCLNRWPAGTIMDRFFGKTEGELGTTYCCPVCRFALSKEATTELHFCWGDLWSPHDYDQDPRETYEYIKQTLEAGAVPTVAGVTAFRAALLAAEDA